MQGEPKVVGAVVLLVHWSCCAPLLLLPRLPGVCSKSTRISFDGCSDSPGPGLLAPKHTVW